MVQTKRDIEGSPLKKNTTQYGEMSSDWSIFDVRSFGDYPRLTHDIIGRGINLLYMSYFIATHPLIVLERKRKHSLLSILSGNMLSNIHLKLWMRGIWGLWSMIRQTSAYLKKMPILDTYVFTERVWYVWKLELSLYMIKPPNRWACRTQGYYVSHDTAPASDAL